MAQNYAIITVAEAKAQLDIGNTGDDDILDDMVDQASARVEAYTGRKIVTQSITNEIHDGDGSSILFPRYFPIVQLSTAASPSDSDILSAVQYRTLPNSDTWTNIETEADYIITRPDMPYIELYAASFSAGTRNIRISYKAGFASGSVELEEIRAVVLQMVHQAWENHRGGNDTLIYGSRSDSSGGGATFSTTFRDLEPGWMKVLDRYRLRRI